MNKSLHAQFCLIFLTTITLVLGAMEKEKQSYLPIILVSGIDAETNGMDPLIKLIKKHLPDVYVKHVIIGLGKITSFYNMYDQGDDLADEIFHDPELRNGFNIVAHSQGGLVSRYFIERYNNPRVRNYIALGSPQRGVDGIPSNIDTIYTWLNVTETWASSILYTPCFQAILSFAGYWNDSLRHDDYLARCSFLPYLNNEKEHDLAHVFKENICKLDNVVLVQSTKEYIVEPAESCHFGFYKEGSMIENEPLFESEIYKNDTLGLKTLYESGRLHLKEAHCLHTDYESDEENFIKNVLPFLKLEKKGRLSEKKDESSLKIIDI